MTKTLNKDELSELLRYFIGDPVPYMQDARFRDLVAQFKATDERDNLEADPRVPPSQRDDDGVTVADYPTLKGEEPTTPKSQTPEQARADQKNSK